MKHTDLIQTQGYWIVEIQNSFYKALKKFQEDKGLSMTEVAEKMEKSPSRLSQIIHGEFNPKLETLVKYALDLGYVPEVRFTPLQEFLDRKASEHRMKSAVLNQSKPSLPRPSFSRKESSIGFRFDVPSNRTFDAPIFKDYD